MSDSFGDFELHASISISTPVSVVAAFSDDTMERMEHEGSGLGDAFEPIPIQAPSVSKTRSIASEQGLDRGLNGSLTEAMRRPLPARSESPIAVRRAKKPKGMPKRPLNAYNLYFQKERAMAMESGKCKGKINVDDFAKEVAKKWQELTERERKHYEELAFLDACRYRREMGDYSDGKEKQQRERERKQFEEFAVVEKSGSDKQRREFEPNYSFESPPPPNNNSYHQSSWFGQPRSSPPVHDYMSAQQPPMRHGHLDMHPYSTAVGMNHGRIFGAYPPQVPPLKQPPPPPPQAAQSQQQPSHLEEVRNSFPIPPGLEVLLPDSDGTTRRYRVKYACFSMTRESATKYMQDLLGDSSMKFAFPEASSGDFGFPVRAGGPLSHGD